MRRHDFLLGVSALASAFSPLSALGFDGSANELARIEHAVGGRLGVFAYDSETGATVSHRANERFAMCSTFKFLAVAAILRRVDLGDERLDRPVRYGASDLLEYAPIARERAPQGYMTVRALCEAAIEYSDNTAANLLLRSLGGPHAVTTYARSLGDASTRLDRMEPGLNTAFPGDPRDTTTPSAMASDMRKILLGGALSPASRARLRTWLINCRTGLNCLRAGMPHSWTVGDKTGLGGPVNSAGDSNTRNDIAIVWPPSRRATIVTAYLTGAQVPAAQRDAALAQVGRTVSGLLSSRTSFRGNR
jgi:beta-lactamase class A